MTRNLALLAMIVIVILVVNLAHGAELTTQRDAPTTRFYDSRGNATGSDTTYGNQTRFYDARGNSVGTATRQR